MGMRAVVGMGVVLACAWVAAGAGLVRAGGTCEPEDPEDFKAVRLLGKWRRKPGNIRWVLKGLCSQSYPTQLAAQTRLRELGAKAVRPLFAAARLKRACAGQMFEPQETAYVEALAKVMCDLRTRRIDDPFCDSRAVKRSPARIEASLAWLLGRLDSPRSRETALQVLERMPSDEQGGCPGRQELYRKSLPKIRKRLKVTKGDEKLRLITLLGQMGPAAADASSDLELLLSDPALAPEAVRSLGLIGRISSASLDAIRALLAKADRKLQFTIIEALGRIGPPAQPALGEVDQVLAGFADRACSDEEMKRVEIAARALVSIGGPGADRRVTQLLAPFERGCDSYPLRTVLQAIAKVGLAGTAGLDILLAAMRDERRSLQDRSAIVEALGARRKDLKEPDQVLARAIARKEGLLSRPTPQVLPPPEARAHMGVAGALSTCAQEIGRVPPDEQAIPEPKGEAEQKAYDELSSCLDNHLCGPSAADRDRALATCCARAWPSSPPAWCR